MFLIEFKGRHPRIFCLIVGALISMLLLTLAFVSAHWFKVIGQFIQEILYGPNLNPPWRIIPLEPPPKDKNIGTKIHPSFSLRLRKRAGF